MSDFTTMRRVIDYVDNLPEGTSFDYMSPCRCVFGIYKADHNIDDMRKLTGLNDWDYNRLYGGIIIGTEVDSADRHGVCQLMREYIAAREPQAVTAPADLELETA